MAEVPSQWQKNIEWLLTITESVKKLAKDQKTLCYFTASFPSSLLMFDFSICILCNCILM